MFVINCKQKTSHIIIDQKKNHTLMFKVLKSIYIFESINTLQVHLNKYSLVCTHIISCRFSSLVVSITECINSCRYVPLIGLLRM